MPRKGLTMEREKILGMNSTELVKWCKQKKTSLKLSNQIVADRSNVPLGTVDRIFSGNYSEFKYNSVQPIVSALLEIEDELAGAHETSENLENTGDYGVEQASFGVNPYEAIDPDGTGKPISLDKDYQIAQQRHFINRLRAEVEYLRIENDRKYEQLLEERKKNAQLQEMLNKLIN